MKYHNYYIYIMSNWNNKVIYVGITNDLIRRVYEHRNKLLKGFTSKYNLTQLVYYELIYDVNAAIRREKEIKGWRREKKNNLIESINPDWKDLYVDLINPSQS
ncbi:MAG: GIY-YIG nuclease family protein [Ignavibacterium sp.]